MAGAQCYPGGQCAGIAFGDRHEPWCPTLLREQLEEARAEAKRLRDAGAEHVAAFIEGHARRLAETDEPGAAGVIPVPKWTEHGEPGGVICTPRQSSRPLKSPSSRHPRLS